MNIHMPMSTNMSKSTLTAIRMSTSIHTNTATYMSLQLCTDTKKRNRTKILGKLTRE